MVMLVLEELITLRIIVEVFVEMVSKQLESCVTMETLCLEMVATVSAT